MKFNRDYTEYWDKAVVQSVDGTQIPGAAIARLFIERINNFNPRVIVDLGCSTGRMSQVLIDFCDTLIGVEPDDYALSIAANKGYKSLIQGTAENSTLDSEIADFVFCWAVFDVTDQAKALTEIHRILELDGVALITGKANQYKKDDKLAFNAEKNAYLKDFPNQFTDLTALIQLSQDIGFTVRELYTFECRGDFGLNKSIKQNAETLTNVEAYEYLVLLCKRSTNQNSRELFRISDKHSQTARQIALELGFDVPQQLFESIGIGD